MQEPIITPALQVRTACVLAEVTTTPGRSATELARAIGESRPRVYQALRALEAARQVERSGDWPARWSPKSVAHPDLDAARLRAVEQLLTEAMRSPGWAYCPRDVAHKVEHAFVELTRP